MILFLKENSLSELSDNFEKKSTMEKRVLLYGLWCEEKINAKKKKSVCNFGFGLKNSVSVRFGKKTRFGRTLYEKFKKTLSFDVIFEGKKIRQIATNW